MSYYYNPYDGQYYYLPEPRMTPYYLPPGEGTTWVDKNVDIVMTNGTKYCNVRFLRVQNVGGGQYIWEFEDYSLGGGPPVVRRISNIDVAEINQAGVLCRPQPTPQPTPVKPWYCYTPWGQWRPECR
ncbi:hypothetical protein [Priestia endophytica]|uniref:hypothetical protein n=1 Tax=Priestia endophytica TaxID=135735 RepID=UPI0018CCC940|nr:hypothetical protein [Priestia endophytica]